MPRKQSKRPDSLAMKLKFNDSVDEHLVQDGNDGGKPSLYDECPLCPCATKADRANQKAVTNCSSCASCLALNVAECTELRDDFCHRDRPRFVFFDTHRVNVVNTHGSAVKFHWFLQSFFVLLLVALLVGILLCLKWVLVEGIGNLTVLWLTHFEDFADHENIWLLEKYWLLGPLSIGLFAVVIGCSCACLSWKITYYDSLKPGVVPTTPFSPIKSRKQTRHVFHFGYILAIANGLAAFTLAWWWL